MPTKAKPLISRVDRNDPEQISYGVYCAALNTLDPTCQVAFSIPGALGHFLDHLKELTHDLVDGLGIGIKDIIIAFKQKDIFTLLKGVGFNLKVILNAFLKLLHTGPKMIVHAFQQLEKDGMLDGLRKGTVKVNEVLHMHPILTKVGGVVIGALLLYMLLFGNFTGHPGTDFDMTTVIKALKGQYDVADILASPQGLTSLMIGLTGLSGIESLSTGISWMGKLVEQPDGVVAGLNLCLALMYTGLSRSGKGAIANRLKPYLFGKKDLDKTFRNYEPVPSHASVKSVKPTAAKIQARLASP